MKITNTPYDDVFRTLLNDCSALIIPVINEVFGECQSSPDDSMLVRLKCQGRGELCYGRQSS